MTRNKKIQPMRDAFEVAVDRRDAKMRELGVEVYDPRIAELQAAVLRANANIPRITCPEHGETMEDTGCGDTEEKRLGYFFLRCNIRWCNADYEHIPIDVRKHWNAQLLTVGIPARIVREIQKL